MKRYVEIAELKIWEGNFYFLDCMHFRNGTRLGFIGMTTKSLFLSVKPEISEYLAKHGFISEDEIIHKILEEGKRLDNMLYDSLTCSHIVDPIKKARKKMRLYSNLEKALNEHYDKIYFCYISPEKNWHNKEFIINLKDDEGRMIGSENYCLENFVGDILVSFNPFEYQRRPIIVANKIPAAKLYNTQ